MTLTLIFDNETCYKNESRVLMLLHMFIMLFKIFIIFEGKKIKLLGL